MAVSVQWIDYIDTVESHMKEITADKKTVDLHGGAMRAFTKSFYYDVPSLSTHVALRIPDLMLLSHFCLWCFALWVTLVLGLLLQIADLLKFHTCKRTVAAGGSEAVKQQSRLRWEEKNRTKLQMSCWLLTTAAAVLTHTACLVSWVY